MTGKQQKENLVGCTGEGKRWEGNIWEGSKEGSWSWVCRIGDPIAEDLVEEGEKQIDKRKKRKLSNSGWGIILVSTEQWS